MRLIENENRILIGLQELVSVARRKACATVPLDEDEPLSDAASKTMLLSFGIQSRERLEYDTEEAGIRFRITGCADRISDNTITMVKCFNGGTKAQQKAQESQSRAEAFILSKILAETNDFYEIRIDIHYVDQKSGESKTVSETVSKKNLDVFFNRCMKAVSIYASPEIERVTERLPSMKSIRFPYKDVRDGQEEFIRRAYKAISKSSILFASAPTGTGKTISAIYPAVKALADGKCDKAFYLTPKTTTAEAARDCINLLTENGAHIRAIILTSKERSCPRRMICREGHDICDMAKCNQITEAVMEVYGLNKPVIDISDIQEIAAKFTVCPYEVELSYSELCDIIICDFNYLFDPTVYIRRFFTERGRFTFLIDEAHNLADRGREMYSAEISMHDINSLLLAAEIGALSNLRKVLPEVREEISQTLMPYLKDEMRKNERGENVGVTHLTSIPENMYASITRAKEALEEEEKLNLKAKDAERQARLKTVRTLLYKMKKLESAMYSFNTGYRLFVFYSNDTLSLKVYCPDPSAELQKRLDKGSSAIFFSATLTPISYYKSLLCEDKYADTLEAESPFTPSQLSVSIIDKISTRYSERERTLPAVARVIAATLSAKRGHYMVFAPSFEYAEAMYSIFSEKYPKVKCMLQGRNMSAEEKSNFLAAFSQDEEKYLLGFCVMGGIYSEGIDLVGDKLIGAIVVGIGMPSLSYERECISEYFEEKYESGKEFAYIYPGMNRVFQAAGRVIRREDDRGVIVLVDDRFQDPIYKKSIPSLWEGMKYISDAKELRAELDAFWQNQ